MCCNVNPFWGGRGDVEPVARCREALLTRFTGVQRDNAVKQHPEWHASPGLGQRIPPALWAGSDPTPSLLGTLN